MYHKTEYRERRSHYAFYSVNAPLAGFDTDRESFLGPYQGLHSPQVVREGRTRNSMAGGWAPVASHYLEIGLAPGESGNLIFVPGHIENPQDEKWESKGVINKAPALPVSRRDPPDRPVLSARFGVFR